MKFDLKKPCNDCPYRKNASPGWLGAGTPEWFVESALSDYTDYGKGVNFAPCHQTVDYEDNNWKDTLGEAQACVGALQFCANNFKSPRDQERSKAVREAGRNEDVFSSAKEFLDYHS